MYINRWNHHDYVKNITPQSCLLLSPTVSLCWRITNQLDMFFFFPTLWYKIWEKEYFISLLGQSLHWHESTPQKKTGDGKLTSWVTQWCIYRSEVSHSLSEGKKGPEYCEIRAMKDSGTICQGGNSDHVQMWFHMVRTGSLVLFYLKWGRSFLSIGS